MNIHKAIQEANEFEQLLFLSTQEDKAVHNITQESETSDLMEISSQEERQIHINIQQLKEFNEQLSSQDEKNIHDLTQYMQKPHQILLLFLSQIIRIAETKQVDAKDSLNTKTLKSTRKTDNSVTSNIDDKCT